MATYNSSNAANIPNSNVITIPVTLTYQVTPKKNQQAKDGWHCFDARDDKGKIIRVHGTIPPAYAKVSFDKREVFITGEYIMRGNKVQFKWSSIEVVQPTDTLSYLKDLGVSKAAAVELIDKHGDDVLKIIETDALKLRDIKGISQKKAKDIMDKHAIFQNTGTLSQALENLKVTPALKLKIAGYLNFDDAKYIGKKTFKKIGNSPSDERYKTILGHKLSHIYHSAADLITQNPYYIATVPGITSTQLTFRQLVDFADSCSLPGDFNHYLQMRNAAVVWAVAALAEKNTIATESEIIDFCRGREKYNDGENQLKEIKGIAPTISEDDIRTAINNMEDILIFGTNGGYTSRSNFLIEYEIFNFLAERRNSKEQPLLSHEDAIKFSISAAREMKIDFSKDQLAAILEVAAGSRTICMSGYAGTGKSTLSKALLDLLNTVKEASGEPADTICLALSGVASDRIGQASEYPSQTIHSALQWVPGDNEGEPGKFLHNRFNPLAADIVLIDEASMIDTVLFHDLLAAIKPTTILLILGDDAQLQPIGPGSVFCDILNSRLMPIVHLGQVFRQSDDSVLKTFAGAIRKGEVPTDYLAEGYLDFEFSNISGTKRIINRVLDLAREAAEYNQGINGFQVLVPKNVEELGTHAFNPLLQEIFNPKISEDAPSVYGIRKKDKVIHMSTLDMLAISVKSFQERKPAQEFKDLDPEKFKIRNGAIGTVIHINKLNDSDKDGSDDSKIFYVHYKIGSNQLIVQYEGRLVRLKKLALAYALTVHKYQGSEAQTVVIPLHYSQNNMLNNKWLYTAITRAREKCHVIGQPAVFEFACQNIDETSRRTVLQGIIADDIAALVAKEKEEKKKKKPEKYNNKLGWTPPVPAAAEGDHHELF